MCVGLQASLLVRDPETGQLLVNFDPQLVKLMRETECMMKINLEIPESAKLLFMNRSTLKNIADDLKVYDDVLDMKWYILIYLNLEIYIRNG